VKTFPIKKRMNTELFIDRKWGLYIQNKGGMVKENIGPLGRG